MAGTQHGITTSAITWEPTETEIEISETGLATISCMGVVGANGTGTAIDAAIQLIPKTLPITATGPVGSSTRYTGAAISSVGGRYSGDDLIEVRCSYQVGVPETLTNPSGGGVAQSDSDRARRMIATEQAPILTNPVVESFPDKDKRLLGALLRGDIWVNPRYDPSGTGIETKEFIREKDDGTGEKEEAAFSSSTVTVGGITASPQDYARMISLGILTYDRKTVRHALYITREDPATNDEYGDVGSVVSTPDKAPTISGDFQWFLTGIDDESVNDEVWNRSYEYDLSGAGGVLQYLYKGGSGTIT
jgi:hypothetical protein